jgi:alcohol dehydrogenase class IV
MRDTTLSNGTRTVVSPGRIELGAGAVDTVGGHAARYGETALVVATERIFELHGDTVIDRLTAAGVEPAVYTDVRPDPTVENVERAHALYERADCDLIVTLGGGSSIDTGKGVGILVANEGSIREFGVDRAGYEGVPNPTPPLVAVNTTGGTGSEATRSVVISDESTSTKFLVVSANVVPDVAVEDPELTVSLPRSHTAFTGIDALTHAIEAYVSVESYSVPDGYAERAMERLVRSLPVAWANGDDLGARADVMVGQLQAGQAFTNASVALVHGLARPLGAQLHLPHGLANGLILPYVVDFSSTAAPEKYAEVARILGVADAHTPTREAADAAAEGVLRLCRDVSLTGYLDDFGDVPDRDAYRDVIDEMTRDAIDSGSPDNNPRKPTREEIADLYLTVYDDALSPDGPRRS